MLSKRPGAAGGRARPGLAGPRSLRSSTAGSASAMSPSRVPATCRRGAEHDGAVAPFFTPKTASITIDPIHTALRRRKPTPRSRIRALARTSSVCLGCCTPPGNVGQRSEAIGPDEESRAGLPTQLAFEQVQSGALVATLVVSAARHAAARATSALGLARRRGVQRRTLRVRCAWARAHAIEALEATTALGAAVCEKMRLAAERGIDAGGAAGDGAGQSERRAERAQRLVEGRDLVHVWSRYRW